MRIILTCSENFLTEVIHKYFAKNDGTVTSIECDSQLKKLEEISRVVRFQALYKDTVDRIQRICWDIPDDAPTEDEEENNADTSQHEAKA